MNICDGCRDGWPIENGQHIRPEHGGYWFPCNKPGIEKKDIIAIIETEMAKIDPKEKDWEVLKKRWFLSYLLAEVKVLGMPEEEGKNFIFEEGFDDCYVYENGVEKTGHMSQVMDGSSARLTIKDGKVYRASLSAGRLMIDREETLTAILKKWHDAVKPNEIISDGTEWYASWMNYYLANIAYPESKPYDGKITFSIRFENQTDEKKTLPSS